MDGLRWYTAKTIEQVFQKVQSSTYDDEFVPPIQSNYTLVLASKNEEMYNKEKSRAERAKRNKVWRTPAGSFFTPFPVGKNAKISFVYGDALSPTVHCIERLFNSLPLRLQHATQLMWGKQEEQKVIQQQPSSETTTTTTTMTQIQKNNAATLVSWCTTLLMKEYGIEPDGVLGFSLGELIGRWVNKRTIQPQWIKDMSSYDEVNPMWENDLLSGEMNILQTAWNNIEDKSESSESKSSESKSSESKSKSSESELTKPKWTSWLIDGCLVENVVSNLTERTRVPVIETNTRCILVGEEAECRRVAAIAGCKQMIPFASMSLVAHVDWVPRNILMQAANEMSRLSKDDEMKHWFPEMYSQTADFRTSVLEAYHEHHMRIFIEVGCCSHRTSSIETILAEYDDVVHVAMNRDGDPKIMRMKAMAELLSHGIVGSSFVRETKEPTYIPVRKVVAGQYFHMIKPSKYMY